MHTSRTNKSATEVAQSFAMSWFSLAPSTIEICSLPNLIRLKETGIQIPLFVKLGKGNAEFPLRVQ